MNKGSTTVVPACAGLRITNDYEGWLATQGWLAEAVRMVTTRLYAQVSVAGINQDNDSPIAVHKAAITAQSSKLFGALFDDAAPQFSISWVVDLLVLLGDLGNIGNGYHIPRESRIVMLASGWGRIAGGLPVELSEHPSHGLAAVSGNTIGRIVRLKGDYAKFDHNTEHSEVFNWMTGTIEQAYARLQNRLPERSVTKPPEETTEFYNAGFRSGRTRGNRWRNKLPDAHFVIARTGTQPAHYYVVERKIGSGERAWFEIEKEEARRWILLLEKSGNILNVIKTESKPGSWEFFLPDMLPRAWTTAILSCASTVVPREGGGWNVVVKPEGKEPSEILLRKANIHLI